jgi:2-keto-4-pentenoate hydratase
VPEVHPRVVAALEAQLASWRAALDAGAGRIGWKLAREIEAVEALVGSEPVIGHLTTQTLLEDGAAFSAAGVRELRAETEVAVEVGRDGTVHGLAVALELVDVAPPPGGLEAVVEANVFHRAVVLGPTRVGARAGQATLRVNGRLRDSAPSDSDPDATVLAARRLLEAVGERLEPGDRVLAGAANRARVAPGDLVEVEIAGLGQAKGRITP